MTTKAGYYGSDDTKYRFPDPKTNETYFTLVNQKTGEIEIYNEEFGADRRVGTMNPDTGKVDYNANWWGGASNDDKNFVRNNTQAIRNNAADMVEAESTLTPVQIKNLTGGNSSTATAREDIEASSTALQSSNTKTNADGTKVDGFGTYVFPKSIRTTKQDIIKFNMMKYRPKDFNTETFGFSERKKGDIIGTVILPIPTGIADNQAVTWGGNNMNAVQAQVAQIALEAIFADNPIEAGIDATKTAIDKIAGSAGEASTGLGKALAGMAVGNNNLMTRTSGAILNPNMELLFGGPSLRPFTFSFNLSPRSKDEANEVINLIRFFKRGMSPIRSKSNLFLKSPHTFQLEYKYRGGSKEEDHPFLNRFKECALQGFGVQYTPTGNYSTFGDGVMTQYQITMSFTELEPVYNDDYDKLPEGSIGF